MLKLKAKLIDVEARLPVVIVNETNAEELGVRASDRVIVRQGRKKYVAIVDTTKKLFNAGRIGIDQDIIGIKNNSYVYVSPGEKPKSLVYIRKKLNGSELKESEINKIMDDIYNDRLSDIELSSYITGVYTRKYSLREIIATTKAMVNYGDQLKWKDKYVVDKHSIGGVPGNRVTPIVVALIAAAGLKIPKTSSRAITSPAGTADTMEVFCSVRFNKKDIQKIVNKTNGCMTWGGSLELAPIDDKLIRVEYPLSLDPQGQVIASVLSKKKSVGSKYVLIDIPVGNGAKVNNMEDAETLAKEFKIVGKKLGMNIECAITKGDQPIGNGVGPVLEAIDVLDVLRGRGPPDLREKSIELVNIIFKMTGNSDKNKADELLDSGKALKKFYEIIELQNGSRKNDLSKLLGTHIKTLYSKKSGTILEINNRQISRLAKAAGSPIDKGAGVYLHIKRGMSVKKGDKLLDIYSEKEQKIKYASQLLKKKSPFTIGDKEDILIEEL